MKTLNKIVQYCHQCKQRKVFNYLEDVNYKIILKETPTTEEKNKKIILRKYGCNKCGITIDRCGYAIR